MLTDDTVCPHCGHGLSDFDEPRIDRAEHLAGRVAAAVGTWRFMAALLILILGWLILNLLARPFEPHPATMLTGLGAFLATVAALYGPLILLTQRRAAERDRTRAREAIRVAVHNESDLHAIRHALRRWDPGPESPEKTSSNHSDQPTKE